MLSISHPQKRNLSICLSQTHTCISLSHTHTHMPSLSRTYTLSLWHTHKHSLFLTQTHTISHSLSHTLSLWHTQSFCLSQAHTPHLWTSDAWRTFSYRSTCSDLSFSLKREVAVKNANNSTLSVKITQEGSLKTVWEWSLNKISSNKFLVKNHQGDAVVTFSPPLILS